jgi:hypothetical protein
MDGKPLCVAQFYLSAGASEEQIQKAFRFKKGDVSAEQWTAIVKNTKVDQALKIRVADFLKSWGTGKSESKFGEDFRFGLARDEIELDAGIKLADTPNCQAEGLGLEAEYKKMKANMARCEANPDFKSSLRQYEFELRDQNTENQKSTTNECYIPRSLISESNWQTLHTLLKTCNLGLNYPQYKNNIKYLNSEYDWVKNGMDGKNCLYRPDQTPKGDGRWKDSLRNGGGLMAEKSFDQIYGIKTHLNGKIFWVE